MSVGGGGGLGNFGVIGDVGVNVYAPPSLPSKPKLAVLKELKGVVSYPKGKKGAAPSLGEWRRSLETANGRINEMKEYVVATTLSVREYTSNISGVVKTSHAQLVKTHSSLLKTIEVNLKNTGELNIKLDSEARKVVATRAELTFRLDSTKALAVADGLAKQQVIKDLQAAAVQLKKERDEAVNKHQRVRV